MTSQDKQPDAQAPGQIAIEPIVVLIETSAKADADTAFYRNRVLALGQENYRLKQTVEAQKAEIERLTVNLGETKPEKAK